MSKSLDVIAFGTCYVDTNLEDYPFDENGIPTETELVGNNYETVAGGSAVNFCRLLQELGLTTSFIGMAGKDSNGDLLKSLLEKSEVTPSLIRQENLLTNVSFNMTNPQGQHIMLAAGTANAALHPAVALPHIEKIVSDTQMFYLGGCFKLKSFADSFDQLIKLSEMNAVMVVVDHGRIPKDVTQGMLNAIKELVLQSTYYFASRDEFCQLWEVTSIEDGLDFLHKKAPKLIVIVKDGGNGAYYYDNEEIHHIKAVPIEKVKNVTGAGDSFNAGVMAALIKSFTLDKAIEYGCSVAAAKISNKSISRL